MGVALDFGVHYFWGFGGLRGFGVEAISDSMENTLQSSIVWELAKVATNSAM